MIGIIPCDIRDNSKEVTIWNIEDQTSFFYESDGDIIFKPNEYVGSIDVVYNIN